MSCSLLRGHSKLIKITFNIFLLFFFAYELVLQEHWGVPGHAGPYEGNCFLYCKIDKRSHYKYVHARRARARQETQQEAPK